MLFVGAWVNNTLPGDFGMTFWARFGNVYYYNTVGHFIISYVFIYPLSAITTLVTLLCQCNTCICFRCLIKM